ncbi:MAG: dihydrolipoyllysine-residue succinyltransferase [Zetaproteobacteria bacterium CG06_land_8_20_14_3_00_59_53]|nr:MAG: dihydrolipoamide succinyltransferase [Zetaproteobacteria bacterium CG2_30_59_37]PIO90338.1 MAG: dihydrolipoyllysine-residue succinyltransferase [Zetaproteobacteria bacterium CG23_combo_of_CG06-09_8_20_14_all_59_86]PIQ65095.1 MAG: dihydrolipoyllysine-residue succinyltransferase [Zetaproteobacteria bacterium CG11_big_fil_rev_8_21_14_0_20_59_439]PIU70152.1 MAG: dihydrolipoyllysine-residue succinyltransferase [Zetaproteobacteria bacterium CG06_land_8_20_14_3_00_59_53]PIU96123.1 MAG: dihydro
MNIDIKVPSLGESESEATLVAWQKHVGDTVVEDDVLAEIESDKITMEVTATASGTLTEVRKRDGDMVAPGEVIGLIEAGEAVRQPRKPAAVAKKADAPVAVVEPVKAKAAEPVKIEAKPETTKPVADVPPAEGRSEQRVPMSALRKTIARRLKEAQSTAAILTTFNEVNMQPVMGLRSRYRDAFKERHGANLGFMSFFVKACVEGLRRFPVVNACVEGEEIIYRNYQDIGIAVSTEKGLVVPVLRDAGGLSMAGIENAIAGFAEKARSGTLQPGDLKGGTFSITNGGVFGSLLSTPILNPPQSAILGMHAIQQRPVAENGQVVIRPMMYIALSYDHRIVDGRDAVQFLTTVKEVMEYPGRVLLDL